MATRTLEIVLAGDASSASRAFRRVEQDADRMGKGVDRQGSRIRGFATMSGRGFARVGVAATGMAAAGAGAVGLLAKSFVEGATSIDESLSKNRVLFGSFAGYIDDFSKTTAANFGISRQAALEAAGTFGNLFRSMKIGEAQSAGLSRNLVQLAADMASFNNATPEEALEAIRSGLVGETEPLRKFGVNLNDAALRAEALRLNLVKTTKDALEPQQKALAVNSLLFKQTEKAQGDFARTSGGLANQQRILKARFADTTAELGGKLMPFALKAVSAINSLFDSSSKGGKAIAGMGRVAAQAADWLRNAWADASRAVARFVRRNQEDIQAVIRAFRNVGEFARNVFQNVLVPAVTAAWPPIKRTLEGIVQAIRGLVRIVTGIINGDWSRAWDGAKDVVRGSLRALKGVIDGVKAFLGSIVKSVGEFLVRKLVDGLSSLGRAVRDAVVSGVKKGVGLAKGAVSDVIGAINPFGDGIGHLAKRVGDGIGRSMQLPSGGAFGGSLDGAGTHLRPFAAIGSRFGLGVSDGLRPGGITSSGNVSLHATGDAIDLAGPASEMLAYFKLLRARFGSRLSELIYTPGRIGIKNGQLTPIPGPIYDSAVAADHFDHVHVGFTGGGAGDGVGHIGRLLRKPRTGDGVGRFESTAYGPPWNAMNGTGVTATGVDLRPAKRAFGIAVDPSRLRLGKNYYVWPNPFGRRGPFKAFDTGGAIKGNRIDFYDWRGRTAQLGWGRRSVRVSDDASLTTSSGGPGGSSGGGGGGSADSRKGKGRLVGSVRPNRGGSGLAGGGFSPAGYEDKIAQVDVGKARAERDDNLAGLINALQTERRLKRRRLKKINKRLRRRKRLGKSLGPLLQEKAALIRDVGEITDLLKEYKADAAGGATSISGAEDLDAGVAADTGDTGEGPPTAEDYLNAELAEASLTPGVEDDIAAAGKLRNLRSRELQAARASGDPRRISAAVEAYRQATGTLEGLKGSLDTANRLAQERLALDGEIVANQKAILKLAGQGDQIVGAVVAAVSGGIGGKVGLGFHGIRSAPGSVANL